MKVGIVGLGFRLGYLAPLFRAALPEFDVVGHVDPDPAGLPRMHDANLSAGKRYDTLEAMLEAERLDLLMVGSPNSMHLDHIRVGLERGMKIFAEKPVVTTEAETLAVARLDRRIRRRPCDGRAGAALRAALRRPAQGAEGRPARRRRLDRGVRAHPALPRRLLHARLAPLRSLCRRLPAGEMLP